MRGNCQEKRMAGFSSSSLPPQAKGRLSKDIMRAMDSSIKEQGICYTFDDTDMTEGWALIQGPDNTPYEGCFLRFHFRFPDDYPFSPPKVRFETSDGKTRFHPNLYIDGKVCLSILGTYSGPSWSGTQSLTSVLLSLVGLLDDNPLTHEPAYEKGTLLDSRHREYADAVEHNMVKLMIEHIQAFEKNPNDRLHPWHFFRDDVNNILPQLKEKLRKKVLEREKQPERLWGNLVYSMQCRSFWKRFAKEVPWIATGAAA